MTPLIPNYHLIRPRLLRRTVHRKNALYGSSIEETKLAYSKVIETKNTKIAESRKLKLEKKSNIIKR